uniref:CARMIL pleckstrin homology domain-containing protein n=1 Tax=Naja naja TaxID=35670 RepID=A0A8C6XW53_NAJNA
MGEQTRGPICPWKLIPNPLRSRKSFLPILILQFSFAESIRKVLNRPAIHLLVRVKLETKPKKNEDRVLVLTTWRIYLFGIKLPAKVSETKEKRANYNLKFPTPESAGQMTRHVNSALAKIFPNPASV